MYPSKRIGVATQLDPVITVDGVDYSLGIKFENQGPSSQSIVSESIHSISDEGSGRKKVVFDRAFQTSSETVVDTAGGTLRVKRHSMGGNVVQAPEPMYLADFGNDAFRSGPRYDKRAVIGDKLTIDGKSYNIVDAQAYGEAPASVDYSGDPVASNNYTRTDAVFQFPVPDNADDTLIVDSNVEPFAVGAGLYWHNGTSATLTAMQRVEFNPDDNSRYTYPYPSASDSFHLPDNLAFAASDPVQYWVDHDNYSVRVADQLSSKTLQGLYGGYYIQTASPGPLIYKQDGESFIEFVPLPVVLSGDGSGFDTGNSIYDVTYLVENAGSTLGVSRQYNVNKVAGVAGVGVYLDLYGNQSQKYLIAVYDGVDTVYIQYRTATTTTTLTTFTPTSDSFQIRIDKLDPANPTTYTLLYRNADGDTWQTGGSVDFPDQPPSLAYMGAMAAANGTINVTPSTWLHGCEMHHLFSSDNTDSRAAYYRAHSVELTSPRQIIDLSDETTALLSVTNQTTGNAMSASATAGRERYSWNAGTNELTLYPESRGDTIRTQFAAPASTSAPGDYPSALATGGLSSSWVNDDGTVANNKANWRDYVIVHDTNDELDNSLAGETGAISRDPVWLSEDAYALYYSPQSSINWVQISGDDLLVDYAAGAIMIKASWVSANLSAGISYCFKIDGPVYIQSNSLDAFTINQIGQCYESLDQAWTSVTFPAASDGVTWQVNGYIALGPTVIEPQTVGFVYSGYQYGMTNKGLAELDVTKTIQFSAPGSGTVLDTHEAYGFDYSRHPGLDGSNPIWGGASHEPDTIEDVNDLTNTQITSTSIMTKPDAFTWVQSYGHSSSYTSAVRSVATPGSSGIGEILMSSYAQAAPFTLPEWITRLPDGSQILEAKLRIKVASGGGQKRFAYISNNQNRNPWANGGVSEYKYTVNDTVVAHQVYTFVIGTGWVLTTNINNPDPGYETDRVDLALALYGRRRRSGAVPIPDKTAAALGYAPADFPIYQSNPDQGEIRFLGTLPATNLTPDVWQIIDVTSYIQTIFKSRGAEVSDYFLYPMGGATAIDPDDFDASGAAGIVAGLMPTTTVEEERNGTALSTNITVEGLHDMYLPSFPQFGECHVRFRLPSGIIDTIALPPIAMPQLAS